MNGLRRLLLTILRILRWPSKILNIYLNRFLWWKLDYTVALVFELMVYFICAFIFFSCYNYQQYCYDLISSDKSYWLLLKINYLILVWLNFHLTITVIRNRKNLLWESKIQDVEIIVYKEYDLDLNQKVTLICMKIQLKL